MAKAIAEMAADLEKALAQHAAQAQVGVNATADLMVQRVKSLSSPEYGVAVMARTVPAVGGKVVQTLITSTGGPGRVFGGQSAVRAQVAKVIDRTAEEGGLDRRR